MVVPSTRRLGLTLAAGALVAGAVASGCGGSVDEGDEQDATAKSAIQNVVLIVMENQTFDGKFGRYCTAPSGAAPTCTTGPACCEAGPTSVGGLTPRVLSDSLNLAEDPNHNRDCETAQINGGRMDQFGAGASVPSDSLLSGAGALCNAKCSRPENIAYADRTSAGYYWTLAGQGAIADRYFQPIVGATSANSMYFATAHWQFDDAAMRPNSIGNADRWGVGCVDPTDQCLDGKPTTFTGRTTIVDILTRAGFTFATYMEGYANARAAAGSFPFGSGTFTGCAHASSDCPYSALSNPAGLYSCVYEPADIPFQYYSHLKDNTKYMKDFSSFALDLKNGTLPSFAYIHPYTFRTEHPKWGKLTTGAAFVKKVVDSVAASATYAPKTLVLITWDEGGGFYDHVSPVAAWPTAPDKDDAGRPVPHGTRVPLIAVGKFARKNTVSHVVMDHASIVRFLEWNFTGATGQLGGADAKVNGIGSLIDPVAAKTTVP